MLFSARFVMLPQNTTHRSFEYGELHYERPFGHRRYQDRWLLQVLLDLIKCSLTIIIPYDGLIFLQQLEQRFTGSCQMRYEPGNVIQTSQETTNFLLRSWCWHFLNSFHFVRIYLDTTLAHYESK